jgi:hypothetical protein
VGKEKGSVDLVNCQVGRRDIPDFQAGKGEEMSSVESSLQEELADDEVEKIPRSDEYSRETVSRGNEDDEKLKTFSMEEEDQRTILIIGGIGIFLPSDRGEARIDIEDAK